MKNAEWRDGFLSGIFDGEKKRGRCLGWHWTRPARRGMFGDDGEEQEDIHIIIQLPQNGTCVMNYDVAIGEREGGREGGRAENGKCSMAGQL